MGSNEDAPGSISAALHIYDLLDKYFEGEILHEHSCAMCRVVEGTMKNECYKRSSTTFFTPL